MVSGWEYHTNTNISVLPLVTNETFVSNYGCHGDNSNLVGFIVIVYCQCYLTNDLWLHIKIIVLTVFVDSPHALLNCIIVI